MRSQIQKFAEESEGLEPGSKMTPLEFQYVLTDFDPVTVLLTDYAELIIQFGYATLFVASYPLAPFMAFVSNYCKIRIKAWKLLQIYKRPGNFVISVLIYRYIYIIC